MRGRKMIIKIVLGIILLIVILIIILGGLFIGVNGKEQEDREAKYNGKGKGKVLVIYQESRMGLTKKAVNLAIKEFQEEGYAVVSNHPRESLTYNVKDYDVIVLASPIYAGKVAEPLLKFEEKQEFSDKKVLILLTGSLEEKTTDFDEVEGRIKQAAMVKKIKVDKADERVTNGVKGVIEK